MLGYYACLNDLLASTVKLYMYLNGNELTYTICSLIAPYSNYIGEMFLFVMRIYSLEKQLIFPLSFTGLLS